MIDKASIIFFPNDVANYCSCVSLEVFTRFFLEYISQQHITYIPQTNGI